MRVIPIPAHAGITGFESPAAEYTQLGLSLDELLITHPNASFLCLAEGIQCKTLGFMMVMY